MSELLQINEAVRLGTSSKLHLGSTKIARVRTVGRFDAASALGGGEVQLQATTAALRRSGLDARPWRPWEERLGPGDVLHCFGSRPEFSAIVEAARRQGASVALSTIAWFDWRNSLRDAGSWPCKAAGFVRYAVRAALPRTPSWRRSLYHAVDVLLPNSRAEADQLMRLFQIPAKKIFVVPNGIDSRIAEAESQPFVERFGLDDFVLCPGRIEPRKNQLALLRALAGSGLQVVVLGDVVPGQERYAEACRRAADANVRFLPRLDYDDPLLASAYAAARCVALVGWYETPGLAALEGAALGTPVIVPECGSTREYFGPWAEYVRPHDLAGIRKAVMNAIGAGRRPEFAATVARQFTWAAAARATREAYEQIA